MEVDGKPNVQTPVNIGDGFCDFFYLRGQNCPSGIGEGPKGQLSQ